MRNHTVPENDLVHRYVDVRKQGQAMLEAPEKDTTEGLWLWLVLCLLVFACIMVNYWSMVQLEGR